MIRRLAVQAGLNTYQRFSLWLTRRIAPRSTVHGIEIIDATASGSKAEVELALDEVLQIISVADARRYRRISKFIAEIIVVPITGAGFVFGPEVCLLGEQQLLHGNPKMTGAMLVHEATHALLHHRGFR